MSEDGQKLVNHSVLLVGNARDKEIVFKKPGAAGQKEVRKAMAREWSNWSTFRATKDLKQSDLEKMMLKDPKLRIVGTRWVITRVAEDKVYKQKVAGKAILGFKARLVVQGCQEEKGTFRRDSPTGSKEAFFLTLAAASQTNWMVEMYDAESAFLQTSGQMKRLLVIRMPWDLPPPGKLPGQAVVALGSIYGTGDASRGWYLFSKAVFLKHGWIESILEKGWFLLPGEHGTVAVAHTHIDDSLIAHDTTSKYAELKIAAVAKELRMKRESKDKFTYCGRQITVTKNAILVDQKERSRRAI